MRAIDYALEHDVQPDVILLLESVIFDDLEYRAVYKRLSTFKMLSCVTMTDGEKYERTYVRLSECIVNMEDVKTRVLSRHSL